MEISACSLCNKNQTALKCGICECTACKYCAQLLDSDSFSFLKRTPKELSHTIYCPACFDAHVSGPLENYQALVKRAGDIDVYFKNQGKETRLIRRTEDPIVIKDCMDRDQLILRLAFFAAQAGFNAVIDIDLTSEKVGDRSYKRLSWSGSGIPANITERTKIHDKSFSHNPN